MSTCVSSSDSGRRGTIIGLGREVLVHGVVAHGAVVGGLRLVVGRRRQRVAHGVLRWRGRHHGRGRARSRAHRVRRRACCCVTQSWSYVLLPLHHSLQRTTVAVLLRGLYYLSLPFIT